MESECDYVPSISIWQFADNIIKHTGLLTHQAAGGLLLAGAKRTLGLVRMDPRHNSSIREMQLANTILCSRRRPHALALNIRGKQKERDYVLVGCCWYC